MSTSIHIRAHLPNVTVHEKYALVVHYLHTELSEEKIFHAFIIYIPEIDLHVEITLKGHEIH